MSPHSTTRAREREPAQHRVEQVAADVVEEHVDTVGRELLEPGGDVFGLVVDARVEAELVDDPRALRRRTGDPDHAGALHLRDLAGDRPDSARGRRHQERLARLRARDAQHTHVRGDPDVPERAEHVGELHPFRHHRDRRERVRGHDAVLLPAREVHEGTPEWILLGVVGLDDHPDAVGPYALADRDSGHVVAALVEPAADRGVDAEIPHFEQRLAVGERRHVALRDVETISETAPTGRRANTI